jgi:hypothetical protein
VPVPVPVAVPVPVPVPLTPLHAPERLEYPEKPVIGLLPGVRLVISVPYPDPPDDAELLPTAECDAALPFALPLVEGADVADAPETDADAERPRLTP